MPDERQQATYELVEEAVILTRYAVAAGYPGEAEPVSREEARQAANLAGQVFLWVESLIREVDRGLNSLERCLQAAA